MRKGLDKYRGADTPSVFNLFSDFDDIFEGALSEWRQPNFDVEENEKSYLLTVDLPGVRQEDVKIDLNGRMLTISGERKRETKSDEKDKVQRFERSYGKFTRSFTLPETVDANNIAADLENGELKLTIPKSEQAKPRSIQIGQGKQTKIDEKH
jgi:HSP20 family protein